MKEEGKEATCTLNANARHVVDGISALLKPALGVEHIARSVLLQQQRLLREIESLNDELENNRTHFETLNEAQREKLDIISAKIARCRSSAALLFRRLSEIKERLLRVHDVILQRRLKKPLEKVAPGEEPVTTASEQGNVAVVLFATEEVEASRQLNRHPEDVDNQHDEAVLPAEGEAHDE
ncbi:hypothetical protein TcYC6_0111380 [Trypanosoma cruzi]|nr:hypothetical protein TcYC6_0111380 [Trypanosoma cruzi]